MERTCKKCGETKPIEEYGKHKTGRDGIYPICLVCSREIKRDYYKANKKKYAMYFKKRYVLNRNAFLEYQKKYKKNNKEKITERNKKNRDSEKGKLWKKNYRLNHKEQKCNSDKKYALKNREKLKKYKSLFYKLNKVKISANQKIYRINNKDSCSKAEKKWYEQNRERILTKRTNDVKKVENCYIVQLLTQRNGMKAQFIKQYPELVELYKVQLKLKRLIKNQK